MRESVFFIITTVLWGLNYHWSKSILNFVPAFEGAFWRYLIASIALFLLSIRFLPSFKTIKKNTKGILLIGGVGLFGFNYFFFTGMSQTSPLNAALIIGLNPALTLVFSALILKTPIHKKEIIGIILATIGVLFLLLKGNLFKLSTIEFNVGDVKIMISSVFFALHHVWVKQYSNASITNSQLSLLTALLCLFALSSLLLVASLLGTNTTPYFVDLTSRDYNFWLPVLGIGALGTGLAYWFWYKGIESSSASKASVFINITPLSTAFFHVIFGHTLESYHIISGAIIISGILIIQTKKPSINKLTASK